MANLLTIDQGNSSAKVAVWNGPELIGEGTYTSLDRECLIEMARKFAPYRTLICSVIDNGPQVVEWLREDGFNARLLSVDLPTPLKLCYDTSTLGADRIAAAVGAWSLFPGENSLVVDMGTAVTYDVVTADGRFAGGNIAPGVGMRLRALRSFTARLPEVNGYGETPLFGHDTTTAMRAGAIRGVVAELNYYRSRLPEGSRVVLSGGWSRRISEFLDFPVTVDSCLVTKGLLSILLHNEPAGPAAPSTTSEPELQ